MRKPTYRILVVEDDPTVLDLLESFFNCELSTAASLSEARLSRGTFRTSLTSTLNQRGASFFAADSK